MTHNAGLNLDALREQLEALEEACPDSTLVIYLPEREQAQFFRDLCCCYLDAPQQERARIRDALAGKRGVQNHLLGYVHASSERLQATGNGRWLQIGLAAASMLDSSCDYRDVLLALADLYVTAEAAGFDPRPEFDAMPGIPADFGTYAVVKSRRR